jgi:hypothetical protein
LKRVDITDSAAARAGSMLSDKALRIFSRLEAVGLTVYRDDSKWSETKLEYSNGILISAEISINYADVAKNQKARKKFGENITAGQSLMEVIGHELGHADTWQKAQVYINEAKRDRDKILVAYAIREGFAILSATEMAIEGRDNGNSNFGVSGDARDLFDFVVDLKRNSPYKPQSSFYQDHIAKQIATKVLSLDHWREGLTNSVKEFLKTDPSAQSVPAPFLTVGAPLIDSSDITEAESHQVFIDALRDLPPPRDISDLEVPLRPPVEIQPDGTTDDTGPDWDWDWNGSRYIKASNGSSNGPRGQPTSPFDASFRSFVETFRHPSYLNTYRPNNDIRSGFMGSRQLTLSEFEAAADAYIADLENSGYAEQQLNEAVGVLASMESAMHLLVNRMAEFNAMPVGNLGGNSSGGSEPTAPPYSPPPYQPPPHRDPGISYCEP